MGDYDEFKSVVIVGSGPCGLAVASRLCEACPGSVYTEEEHQRFHWLKQRDRVNFVRRKAQKYTQKCFKAEDILVLDGSTDKFLGQWDSQFDSCQIPFLRSPMFFHPDPVNVDAMVTFAHVNKREKELKEIENVVGREYSKHQTKRQLLKHHKHRIPFGNTHDQSGLVDINMRDWRDYYRPSTKFFRDFCQDIVDRYDLNEVVKREMVVDIDYTEIVINGIEEKGFLVKTDKKVYGCKICILATGHLGKPNFPIEPINDTELSRTCHTSHIFQRKVPFPPAVFDESQQKSLVIVGGGLTSAQLAHVAANAGIQVTLLVRGRLKVKHFDFHLDWVTKYRNLKKSSFYIRDTDEERFEMIMDAREGGSVNPEYHKLLRNHEKAGRMKVLKHTTIEAAEYERRWSLSLNSGRKIEADYIVCATGNQANIEGLPFLQKIWEKHPIKTVQGFPCLTDNLEWKPDMPFFITGKNASLKLGPSSANLDGARLGAERIGWFVQDKLEKERVFDDEPPNASFEIQLKIASGQMNRYDVLQSA